MGIDKVESLPAAFAKDGLIERVGGVLFRGRAGVWRRPWRRRICFLTRGNCLQLALQTCHSRDETRATLKLVYNQVGRRCSKGRGESNARRCVTELVFFFSSPPADAEGGPRHHTCAVLCGFKPRNQQVRIVKKSTASPLDASTVYL